MNYDVAIIGAGLGGLECGYILSKNGMKVCIVEKERVLGGSLQTFKRGNVTFDTGFHYVGALDEGESLNRLFHYFNLMELPWKRLDDEFDTVIIDGERYPIMSGHKAFYDALAERFPSQKNNLRTYIDKLKGVGDHIFDALNPKEDTDFYSTSLFGVSAKAFIDETITDQRLRDVLCGTSLKMELTPQLPLYTFAQINDSFLRGAYRLDGGGELIAEHLAADIEAMGGVIMRNCTVKSIKVNSDGEVSGIVVNDNELIESKWVISNAHPAHTISLIEETPYLKRIYRSRINRLENTTGAFTANIRLKEGAVNYLNKNLYIYENADLWNYTPGKTDRMLIHYYPNDKGQGSGDKGQGVKPLRSEATENNREGNNVYVENIDIITPMAWSEVERWADKTPGHRGDDYVAMKDKKYKECLDMAEKWIPCLKDGVDRIFTSTPLTYKAYTNTENGSSYGIRKDFESPMTTVLTPRTPIKNLLLTGQNLNLHGVLGVSMTALFTCREIIKSGQLIVDSGQRIITTNCQLSTVN